MKIQFLHYFPQGDNNEIQAERIMRHLKEGWKIISSAGINTCIAYILTKEEPNEKTK